MVTSPHFTLFNTEIGPCGLVWGTDGIVGVQLPEPTEAATRQRILRRFPGAVEAPPHPEVQSSQDAIVELLSGQRNDLAAVRLDMSGVPSFHRRVYEVARSIPPGTTMTYGQIAKQLGAPGAARAVGQALGKNPFAIVVPCHRVVAAGGKSGGFSGYGGVVTKLKLLAIEGLHSDAEPDLFGDVPVGRFDVIAGTEHLRRNDPVMARLIDMIGDFHLPQKPAVNTFTALTEAIVHQQLSTKAAATIFARVRAIFQHARPSLAAEHVLQASDETLRAAGLSAPKARALRDLAQRTIAGEIPSLDELHTMEDEDIIECLTKVHGIGRWTAEMLLIFRLGRPDVLPVDDYTLRKSFAIAFRKRTIPTPDELRKRAVKWVPYRTMASWYLWRFAELNG